MPLEEAKATLLELPSTGTLVSDRAKGPATGVGQAFLANGCLRFDSRLGHSAPSNNLHLAHSWSPRALPAHSHLQIDAVAHGDDWRPRAIMLIPRHHAAL